MTDPNTGDRFLHPGTLFTDEEGIVILADPHAARLLGYFDVQDMTGEPLYHVLGVSPHDAQQLLNSIKAVHFVQDYRLQITTHTGQTLELTIEGQAAFVGKRFVGVDIDLIPVEARLSADFMDHRAYLREMADMARQAVDAESGSLLSPEKQTLLHAFFTDAVRSLYLFLARMGGRQIVEIAEARFNQYAGERHWPVRLAHGQVDLPAESIDTRIYRELLALLADYAVDVASVRLVKNEWQKLTRKFDENVVELAREYGLEFLV